MDATIHTFPAQARIACPCGCGDTSPAFEAMEATEPTITGYEITFTRSGEKKAFKTRAAAEKAQHKADSAYGACCTTRRAIWSDEN